jgi:hypothetical protein
MGKNQETSMIDDVNKLNGDEQADNQNRKKSEKPNTSKPGQPPTCWCESWT